MIGYFTKHGDGGVDLLPIGDLYKTQVRQLAKHLHISQEIIDRPPTAGLWDGQTDEAEIGLTYEKLDQILEALEKKKDLKKFAKADISKVKKLIKNSEHKRQLPKIAK
jgi:NAD+ synthase